MITAAFDENTVHFTPHPMSCMYSRAKYRARGCIPHLGAHVFLLMRTCSMRLSGQRTEIFPGYLSIATPCSATYRRPTFDSNPEYHTNRKCHALPLLCTIRTSRQHGYRTKSRPTLVLLTCPRPLPSAVMDKSRSHHAPIAAREPPAITPTDNDGPAWRRRRVYVRV